MKQRKITWVLIVVLVLMTILSPTVISKKVSSPEFHAKTIAELDEKRNTILVLTAATTAASVGIAAAPGDATTPIATEIAKLNDYFVTALSAIFVEKYLLTTLNQLVFTYLVPICCILLIVSILLGAEWLFKIGLKVGLVGLALIFVIPVSVNVSKQIEDTHKISFSISQAKLLIEDVEESNAASESVSLQEESSVTEKQGFWASVQSGLVNITTSVTETVENAASSVKETIEIAKQLLNELVEMVAIVIVLNCLIPIATLSFFVWIVQLITGIEIKMPYKRGMTKGMMDKVHSASHRAE